MPLSSADQDLVAAASAVIRRMYVPEWQHVGAALRTGSGRVYEAVNLDAYVGRCAVCAEAIALGKAFGDGERAFDTIVAVRYAGVGEPEVVSPCGICRELLTDYGDPYVIHPDARGRLRRTRASKLLPARYRRAREAHSSPAERERAARRIRAGSGVRRPR